MCGSQNKRKKRTWMLLFGLLCCGVYVYNCYFLCLLHFASCTLKWRFFFCSSLAHARAPFETLMNVQFNFHTGFQGKRWKLEDFWLCLCAHFAYLNRNNTVVAIIISLGHIIAYSVGRHGFLPCALSFFCSRFFFLLIFITLFCYRRFILNVINLC